jgi:DNA-binding XRE family transcriptional regulator
MPKTPFGKQFDELESRFDRRRLVREIGAAVRRMRFETKMLQMEIGQSIRTSQTAISRIERELTIYPRFDALECIAHNLRYKLVLDGGVRVRKKPSWRPVKRKPSWGRGMWSSMIPRAKQP